MCAPMPMFKFLLCLPHQVYFGMLDALLASEELPEEYRDRCQVKHLNFILSSNSYQAHYLLNIKVTKVWYSRISCATTVIRRGMHPSTGCTINVGFVGPIILE